MTVLLLQYLCIYLYMYLQNGLAASYLVRDGASPRIYPLVVMILGNGYISDRGETETTAVDLHICDREEEPDPTSTLHSNDDVCLKPPGDNCLRI